MNLKLKEITKPGIMLSQVHPTARDHEGETLRSLEMALEKDFFEAYQTVEVNSSTERKQIAKIISEQKLSLTCSLSRVQIDNDFNLSSLDENLRQKSVEQLKPFFDNVREEGAKYVQVLSGPRPDDKKLRHAALEQLKISLIELCEITSEKPALKIIIEPLDFDVHKKGTLGSTHEAVELLKSVRKLYQNITLCLDTSHMILNGENSIESLQLAVDFADEFHFCNCVTDADHPLYGDYHIPFGSPGRIDIEDIARIMIASTEIGYYNTKRRPAIFCEVFNKSDDINKAINYVYNSMLDAWNKIQEIKT